MSPSPEQAKGRAGDDFVPADESVRRQGIEPITSADELVQPDPWESEVERDSLRPVLAEIRPLKTA